MAFLLVGLGAHAALAQTTSSRLAGDWQSTPPVALSASQPPLGRAGLPISGTDQGAASGDTPLGRMILLLSPSAAQQQALAAELANLQNPSSPQYRQWLTPAAFANAYANSASDVGAVVAWLQSQGFTVAPLPASRGWIEFSGTVAQAEQAFHAQIHLVAAAGGVARPVLMSDISVPGALKPVIDGLVSLDGVVSAPALTAPQSLSVSAAELAAETSPASAEALTPQLESQLVDLGPLSKSNVTGANQTIAIAARSNINTADVAAFRAAFGLPASTLSVAVDGADPGLTADQAEATLAASWAGAAAPGAQIVVVPAATTNATDGIDLSLAAIVDRNLASTAAVGYSACEAGISPAHQAFYSALYQQAAAEGITVVAATGDNGAAACAAPGALVNTGYGVNALASTPWNTAVGVAAFSSSGPSALAAWSPRSAADPEIASGGGSSALYALPAWQPVPSHLPTGTSNTNRLLPDLSLPAAIDASANPGLAFCLSDGSAPSSGCTLVRSGGSAAAAAYFAGIAALMSQQHGLEGNLAPTLYQLSRQSGIFNDVQQGSAQLKCAAGSPGCDSSGEIGFSAAAGFDPATGLGVPDAAALVNAQPASNGTTPVIVTNTTASGQTINPSGSVTLSATVSSGTGTSPAPTGTFTFFDQTTSSNIITVSLAQQTNTSASASQTVTGAFAQGTHQVIAEYSGDSVYQSGNSTAVAITAAPSATTLSIVPATNSPGAGSSFIVTATVTSANAGAGALAPSGTVTFSIDGTVAGTGHLIAGQASGGSTNSTASATLTAPYSTGSHTITASYGGDANYVQSNSNTATINVSSSTPTVTLTAATTTPGAGGSDLMTVTIAPAGTGSGAASPSGSVTFQLDGNIVGTANVTSGNPSTASFTLTNLTLGTHTVQASYSGDTNYNSAISNTVTLSVGKTGTSLTISIPTNSPIAGSQLQVTATLAQLTPSTGTPTGNVTFTLDNNTISVGPVSNGTTSTTTITVPTTGTHTIGASYSGDGNFAASTASPVSFTVAKTSTTTVDNPSTTTPALGSTVTVSTSITPSSYSASGDPTGTVTYTVGSNNYGTYNVTPGTPSTAQFSFTAANAGTFTLEAVYSGDSNYAASTAAPITLTIAKVSTTTTVTPATTTPTVGDSLQVSASVSNSGANTTGPTGSVTFTLDGANVATTGLSGGSPSTATTSFTVPSAGSHVLAATYPGDTNFASSVSNSVTLNVGKSTPTILLTPGSVSPSAGSSLQLTAQISAANGAVAPTGTVVFTLDGAPAGTAVLNGGGSQGTATLTITTPSVGAHTLQASYSGDGNYNTVTSSTVNINVSKGNTTLTVSPSTTQPTAGSSMLVTATLSASVTGATVPTGTVSFTMDGGSVGSASLLGGTTASVTVTVPTSGTHTLQASYSGDSNFNAAVAPTVTFTVAKTVTTTVVIPSTTQPALGASLPVTANVTAASQGPQPPTGNITFTVDGVTQGIQPLTPGTPSTASFTLPALSPGTHTISATYSGDTYYATSTASGTTVSVAKDPTTVQVSAATTTPAGGSSLGVSATISPATPGTTLPTGTVNFTIDGATVVTSQVLSGTPATASGTIASVPAGTHVLQAVYSGDSYYGTATSQSLTLTASKSPTTITISPSTLTPAAGGSMTVTANITSTSPGTVSPTGTVTISMDGVTVGTGSVVPGNPSIANINIPLVSAGTHLLQGVYSGDGNYSTSTSQAVSIVASKGATTTTVTASPASLAANTPETLTATIAPTTAVSGITYTITGTVSFYDGTTLLGQVAVSNNTAVLSGLKLANNISHSITAVYSGDLNWLGSTSTVLPLEATTLPDTVVLTSNLAVAPPGAAVVLTATVTPSSTPTAGGEPNPTGTVAFYQGTTLIGTAALQPVAQSDSSTATLTIQTLPGGQDQLTAVYQGDLFYDEATSLPLSIIVETFTISPASTNPPTNLDIVEGGAGSVSFNITGYGGFNNQIQVICTPPAGDNMTCTASPQQVTPPGSVTFVVQTYTKPLASNDRTPLWPRTAGGAALAGLLFLLLPFGRRARMFMGAGSRRMLILLLLLVGLAGAGIGCTSNNSVLSQYGTPLGVATFKVTATSYVDNTVVSQNVYFTVNVVAPGTVTP